MADTIIQMTDANGDNAYPKLTPRTYFRRVSPGYSNAAIYTAFARAKKYTGGSANGAIMLLSGIQTIASLNRGVFVVQTYNRNSSFSMSVTRLAPVAGTAPVFGYWDGGDGYWYIGVLQQSQGSAISVCVLDENAASGYAVILATADEFYHSATEPTGWTAVSTGTP